MTAHHGRAVAQLAGPVLLAAVLAAAVLLSGCAPRRTYRVASLQPDLSWIVCPVACPNRIEAERILMEWDGNDQLWAGVVR